MPLNAAESPRRKKITTQVLEGLPCATQVSVCPEPVTPRKPPALLASPERVVIDAFFPPLSPVLFLPFLRTGSVSEGTLTGVTGRGGALSIGVEERGMNGLQDGALVSIFESTVAVCPLKCLFRRMQLFV
jgi:hypothetical protein